MFSIYDFIYEQRQNYRSNHGNNRGLRIGTILNAKDLHEPIRRVGILGKRPDYLWFTVFDEHGDHARLAVLAALFGAIDRAPYRSNFAPVRLAKAPKRFGKPLSAPLNTKSH